VLCFTFYYSFLTQTHDGKPMYTKKIIVQKNLLANVKKLNYKKSKQFRKNNLKRNSNKIFLNKKKFILYPSELLISKL
jgi:hypothetical protein